MAKVDGKVEIPALDAFSTEQLEMVRDWLNGCRDTFVRGKERCLDAYRSEPVSSLLANADYYGNCMSAVGFMTAQITKKINKRARAAKESTNGPGGPAKSGL